MSGAKSLTAKNTGPLWVLFITSDEVDDGAKNIDDCTTLIVANLRKLADEVNGVKKASGVEKEEINVMPTSELQIPQKIVCATTNRLMISLLLLSQ